MSPVAAWLTPALAGLALTTWVGGVATRAVCPDLARESRAVRLALGYGAGMGLGAGLLFLLGAAGVTYGAAWVVGGQVAAAIGIAGAVAWAGRPQGTGFAREWGAGLWPFARAGAGGAGAGPRSPWTRATLAAIALVVLLVALLSLANGAAFVDAREIWMLKARAFFLDRGLDGPYFAGWPEVLDRRAYPPLHPLHGTSLHLLCGAVSDGAVKLAQAATSAALLVLVHAMVRRAAGPLASAAATLLFALCGPAVTLTVWGNADLALALYVLAAVWAVERSGGGASRRDLVLAGLLLACASFTKLEGVLVVVSLAAAVQLAFRRRPAAATPAGRRARLGGLARLALPSLAVAGAWLLFCVVRGLDHYLARTETIEAVTRDPGLLLHRAGVVAARLLDQGLSERWLYAWPLFVLALIVSRRGRGERPADVVPVFVGCQLAAYFAVFVLLSRHMEWHVQTAMVRLLFHVFPVAYAFTVARLAGADAGRRGPQAVAGA